MPLDANCELPCSLRAVLQLTPPGPVFVLCIFPRPNVVGTLDFREEGKLENSYTAVKVSSCRLYALLPLR